MRLIDADALINKAETVLDEHKTIWFDAVSVNNIDSAPSINLVRCAECRWSSPRTLKGETGYRCVFYRIYKAENGYCDIGEREGE